MRWSAAKKTLQVCEGESSNKWKAAGGAVLDAAEEEPCTSDTPGALEFDSAANVLRICDGSSTYLTVLLGGSGETHVLGATTAASIAVSGAFQLGTTDAACQDSRHGSLRWSQDRGRVEVCTIDNAWAAIYQPPPESCQQIVNENPAAASGMYDLTGGNIYCDMHSEPGKGWTRFLRHSDTGNVAISNEKWDDAIQTAASAGIHRWMWKTYTSATSSGPAGSSPENTVISTLASSTRGPSFTFFKYQTSSCNSHRYSGHGNYISSSTFVSAYSSCTSPSHSGKPVKTL